MADTRAKQVTKGELYDLNLATYRYLNEDTAKAK
jgi:hypothetical protein